MILSWLFVVREIAAESDVLQFSSLQKHKRISTSTDFLPWTICTACNSRLQPESNAYWASAQPRNTGAEMKIVNLKISSNVQKAKLSFDLKLRDNRFGVRT